MRKICVVTGSRAEYGLLYWLMKEIKNSQTAGLQLIVTGMHLSSEFGSTWEAIEADGFDIHCKVDIKLSSDKPVAIVQSMSQAMTGIAEALDTLKPDVLLVLGDRFEIFAAVSAAMMLRIPVAHIHGGEVTEGVIDEAIRHSISKMSHLHFTATEIYRQRVIQLGESPTTVFNVGAAGLDNIEQLALLGKTEFEEAINFTLAEKNLLITFHPVTLEESTAKQQFSQLLKALDQLQNTHLIFTRPNADSGGRILIDMINSYVDSHQGKAVVFASMGQINYLSALQYMDGVIGNSSSGLIEAPSFKIATVNIGDRQRGRIKAGSVIDCLPECDHILTAIEKIYSAEFQKKLALTENPYGYGGMAKKVFSVLKNFPLENILKKKFYDVGGH